jgi:microsomal dipeptidase-like Zn-dependent dipeptidase
LLWNRDLSQAATYGHGDIPRLIAGNVALQMFTTVTKVPRPLRLENNDDRSDGILRLTLVQRWPPNTWFSLKARALHQAHKLRRFAQKSADTFRIVETRSDLEQYLADRQTQPQQTAGLLGIEGAHALEGTLKNLEQLYDAGFRMVGLAHFFDTDISGSAHGLERGGLTP